MVAGENMIEMHRGDALRVSVTCKAENSAKKLVPVDITNATAVLSVKKKWQDEEYQFQVDGVIEDAAAGEIYFDIEPDDTQEMVPGKYEYDVQLTLANLKPHTINHDVFKLLPDITRPES